MLTNQTANASRVTTSSGGGESANIYAPIFDNKPVTNFTHGSLPCKSRNRRVYYRPAVHRLSSGLTNSVIVYQAPLTRTHCPPPPYCLSSLARSSYHTTHTSVTVYDVYWQRWLATANVKRFASLSRQSTPVGAVSDFQRNVKCP